MSRRHYSSVAVPTTTTSSLDATITSVTVTALSGYPAVPFTLVFEPDTSNEEVTEVTAVVGTSLTITRGVDGSSGRTHAIGVAVEHRVSARDFDEPNAHIAATTGVHGLTGAVVGTSDVQTLTDKTLTAPTVNGGVLDAASTIGGVSGTSLAADRTAWTAYTPTVDSFTLGSGTLVAADQLVGKSLKLRVRIATASSTGTGFALLIHLRPGLTAAVTQDFPIALYFGTAVVPAFGSISAGTSTIGITYGPSAATLTGSAFAGTGGQVLSFVTELEIA